MAEGEAQLLRQSERDVWLTEMAKRVAHETYELTVRELIEKWGARSRGHRVVAQVRNDLRRHGLTTVPDITYGYIDSRIQLALLPSTVKSDANAGMKSEEQFLRVGSLQCASQGVAAVPPDADLDQAMTLMVLNDFSQLAVSSSQRHVQLAVSWESLGRQRLVGAAQKVRDASTPTQPVFLDDALLPLLPEIARAGFLIVQDRSRTATGIVTAADVTNEFGALAEPFFLLGEIERRLRLVLSRAGVTDEEMADVAVPNQRRKIGTVEDLTLGQIERLLESPLVWDRVGWSVDRRAFVNRLRDVREIRNSLVHFSLDVPSPEDVVAMRNLLRLLQQLGSAVHS